MNELKTLQEGEIQKEINKLKKDFDFMIIPEHSERIWYIVKCLAGLASEKAYTLGLMKGVEMVEGELPKYPPNSDREELVIEQIKGIINKLKQELK